MGVQIDKKVNGKEKMKSTVLEFLEKMKFYVRASYQ